MNGSLNGWTLGLRRITGVLFSWSTFCIKSLVGLKICVSWSVAFQMLDSLLNFFSKKVEV